MDTIKPTAFQERCMMVPEDYDLFLGGGRGGGKSFLLLLLGLRHVEQHGNKARVLYVRKSYKATADFEQLTRDVFATVYGGRARYNAADHVWRFPGGGFLELAQLEGAADYSKFQGRSFSLLMVDEAGEYSTGTELDRLRSNLRGPRDVPIRTVLAANPGGVGHAWLTKRYVFKGAPWQPFLEEVSNRRWVYAPSTFLDNPELDQEQYQSQLRASCPTDPDLLKAWLTGDWNIARGAYFGSVIDEKRNAIEPWPNLPKIYSPVRGNRKDTPGWYFYLAHDYGSSAPSVTYVCAESPGDTGPDGRYYPRDSIVLVDELATVDPDDLNQGMGYTVPRLSDEIKEMAKRWGIHPQGIADDAIFSDHGHQAGSIAQEFKRAGVMFKPARKGDRLSGWETMRRLLSHAGEPDRPGLYISRACQYWWETVPFLGRDPRRVEDVDTRGPDHAADACRYGCTPPPRPAMSIDLKLAF